MAELWVRTIGLFTLLPFASAPDDYDYDDDNDCCDHCDCDDEDRNEYGDFNEDDEDTDGCDCCSCDDDRDDSKYDDDWQKDIIREAMWLEYLSERADRNHRTDPAGNKNTAKSSRKSKPRPDNELKSIRRKAFLFKRKQIRIGYCADDLIGKNIATVQLLLHNQAFTKIKITPIKDIGPRSRHKVGAVKEVLIGGKSCFLVSDTAPYDAEILISYHEKKEIQIPFSARSLRKCNAEEVRIQLEKLGFTNIIMQPKRHIMIGPLHTEGEVERVTINGVDSFVNDARFEYDVGIIIEYRASMFS